MRINTYRNELNNDLHNILVKEKSCNYPCKNLNTPESIARMLNEVYRMNKQAEEHLYMIAMNSKNKVLGVFEISHGTVNASICNPRDIFVKALLCGATYIILAHNHPSQDVTPSMNDIQSLKRVSESGKMIGVEVLDNLIIGEGFFSFREHKMIQ